MADTIKLPGLGETKKSTAYVIGAGLVLVVGVAWYRSKHQAAATDTTTSSTTADQQNVDAATGYTSGSAEDLAALAAQSGGYGGGAYYGTGQYGGLAGPTGNPGQYVTNGQWAQAAEDYMAHTLGEDATTVAAALGKYITGQALTSAQVGYVQQAIAFQGYPPVNGTDGYPPSYRSQPVSAPPPPTGTGGKLARVSGLHAIDSAGPGSIDLSWNPVTGAKGYSIFYSTTNRSGSWHRVIRVSGTSGRVSVPKRGTRYYATVAAVGSDGKDGPYANPISFTTRRK